MASSVTNLFCSLCGVVMTDPFHPMVQASADGGRLCAIRAVYTRASRADTAKISAVGSMRDYSNVLWTSSQLFGTEKISLFRDDGSDWGFGFHDACWRFLVARLDDRANESVIAESLFRQFYCTPCRGLCRLDFGHEYDGVVSTGALWRVNLSQGYDFTFNDPFAVNLHQLEQRAPPPPLPSWTCPQIPNDNSTCFGRLPAEVLHEILFSLSYTQVKKLRLVCREFAILMRPEALPMSFWRAQFLPSGELGFMFADVTKRRDWYRALRGVEWALRNRDHALLNRKRIAGLLEPIAALVERDAATSYRPPDGTVLSQPIKNTYSPVSMGGSIPESDWVDERPLLTGRRSTIGASSLASDDCREIHTRMAPIPFQGNATFAISTVSFGTDKYISGISWMGEESGGIGFCHSPKDTCRIPPGSSVESLEVTFCVRGLIGVKWNFTNGSSSPWVGRSQGRKTARGILTFRKEHHTIPMMVGLDHYKIVSIGILYPGNSRKALVPRLSVASCLWTPDVPRHKDLFVSPPAPTEPPRGYFALLDIDFGGSQGSLLARLTRMVVHVSTSPRPISGMDFFYTDGSMRSFGVRGQSEMSFYLNGPEGERISEVIVVNNGLLKGLTGFKLSTNFGRHVDFVTLRSLCQESSRTWVQKPPEGHVVTGFMSISEDDRLFNLGTQSQPAASRVIHTPSDEPCNARIWPDSMCSKSICDYHTYVSLRGIHRITAFVGMQQRSRMPSDMCGLKVDYHDHRAPGLAGQLIQETDSFEIARGEGIQAVTVWMTRVGTVQKETDPIPRQGKVVATRVDTTHDRTATFGPYGREHPAQDECVQYRYEAEGHDTLTGISWILNTNYDRVKVLGARECLGSWNQSVELPKLNPSPPGPIAFCTNYISMCNVA